MNINEKRTTWRNILNGAFLLLGLAACIAFVREQSIIRDFDKKFTVVISWLDQAEQIDGTEAERTIWKSNLIKLQEDLEKTQWGWRRADFHQAQVIAQMCTLSAMYLRDNKLREGDFKRWQETMRAYEEVTWPRR